VTPEFALGRDRAFSLYSVNSSGPVRALLKSGAESELPSLRAMDKPELEARFRAITDLLGRRGVRAGTAHRRITVPKEKLTEEDLHTLGFEPVLIAVPEAGQDRFESFRHPDNNFHIHSHPDRWSIHRDRHPSATMLARRYGPLKSLFLGAPHLVSEGIPGMASYLRGQLLGRGSTADKVEGRLKEDVRAMLASLPPSPTFRPAEKRADQVEPLPEPPKPKSWLPALAAAGLAGAGTYKFLRTPRYSDVPTLARLQRFANRKGFHPIIDASKPTGPRTSQGLWDNLSEATRPKVDAAGQLDRLNRLKLWLRGGGEAIPTYTAKRNGIEQELVTGTPRGAAKTDGLVFGRASNSDLRRRLRGGRDMEGSLPTQRALTDLGRRGKDFEAQLLSQHAPDAAPYTVADLGDVPGVPARYRRLGSLPDRVSAARDLQRSLEAHFRDRGNTGWLLKPTVGVASSGKFPRSGQDFGALVEKYERHLASPEAHRAFTQAKRRGPNDLAKYLKTHGIHEGHVLHEGLRYPGDLIAQEAVQNPLGEFRVHAVGGSVPPELILPRHRQTALQSLTSPVRKDALRAFVEDDVLAKLPAKYRRGMYGMDVMPFRRPDGSTGFKVIEMNPHERGNPLENGGGSGLLDSDTTPFATHNLYRAITGRHTEPVALAGGLASGLGAGALTRALLPARAGAMPDDAASAEPRPHLDPSAA
jgi:hypothetical protein